MMLYPDCGYFNEERNDEYAPPYGECEYCYRYDICKKILINENLRGVNMNEVTPKQLREYTICSEEDVYEILNRAAYTIERLREKINSIDECCETCVYYNTDKDDQPCCSCVDGKNWERDVKENGYGSTDL